MRVLKGVEILETFEEGEEALAALEERRGNACEAYATCSRGSPSQWTDFGGKGTLWIWDN